MPLQHGIRFFQHPLPTKPSPFLTVGIPFHLRVWGLLGLPSSQYPTFNRTLREMLSPGCAMDDKGMKKNHSYPATHHFGLGVSAIFRRFLITRFIASSLSQESGEVSLPLFIRTPRATFIARGSVPKYSVTCHHVSFEGSSRIPPVSFMSPIHQL